MPLAFAEIRFPTAISYGSSGGPGFSTTVFEATSGYEQRNSNWQNSRARYDVTHGVKTRTQLNELIEFFYAMRGRATGFRYKDWSDYKLEEEQIGVGNGVLTTFQITKTYGATQPYVRKITKIVAPDVDTNVPFVVKVNNVVIPDTDYTIDLDTGEITFDAAVTNTHTVKVTCQFDVPVRFDIDQMDLTEEAWELGTWDGITLVELKQGE